MMTGLLNTLWFSASYLILFTLAELAYHRLKLHAEFTRKFVHIIAGAITLLFPVFLYNHWLVMALCSCFFIILLLSKKFQYLKSIHSVNRDTLGSLLFPISVYMTYRVYEYFQDAFFYDIPIILLTVSDPLAAIIGRHFPCRIYKVFNTKKSLGGSAIFFVSAFTIATTYFMHFTGSGAIYSMLAAFPVAILSTIAEAVSTKGYDNLTIPLTAIFTIMVLKFYFHLL